MNKSIIFIFSTFVILFSHTSCGIYSFTGANTIAKNIFIANFINRTGQGPTNIGQNLTEQLKSYYQQNSSLKLSSNVQTADLSLEGSIVGYQVAPIATTSQDRAESNRLTITVEVKFVNTVEKDKDKSQNFSFYSDFNRTQSVTQVENQLIDIIFTQIVFDIFNKTLADW